MTVYEIYQCAQCGKRQAILSSSAMRNAVSVNPSPPEWGLGWIRVWDLPDNHEQHPTATLTYCPEHAADGLTRAVDGPQL